MNKLLITLFATTVVFVNPSVALAQSDDLFIWAKQPEAQLISYMRRSGDSVRAIDKDTGRTLLHYAAMCTTSSTSIPFLLRQGLDPNAKDYLGATPIMYAAKKSCIMGVRELASAGVWVQRVVATHLPNRSAGVS